MSTNSRGKTKGPTNGVPKITKRRVRRHVEVRETIAVATNGCKCSSRLASTKETGKTNREKRKNNHNTVATVRIECGGGVCPVRCCASQSAKLVPSVIAQ